MSGMSLLLAGGSCAALRSSCGRGKSVLLRCVQEQHKERSLDYGEVERVLGCRSSGGKMQYLIRWKDEHPETWEPADNIADDVLSEYMGPWWQAARKADADKLRELLQEEEEGERDVDALDDKGRTALMFAAGLGSETCVRLLVDFGADLNWQDNDGFTALHLASGYVQPSVVKALLELGADPDLEDAGGRTALKLAQGLQARMPRGSPMHFARRLALDQVLKLLDEASFEVVPVEQIMDKRVAAGNRIEYLIRWADDQPDSWVDARDVSEDLIRNYE